MADHIDDEERWSQTCEHIHSDIAGRLSEFDGSMLVKYVALVEALGDDGERALFTLGSKDLKPWESLGMMAYAAHIEQAATVHEERGD